MILLKRLAIPSLAAALVAFPSAIEGLRAQAVVQPLPPPGTAELNAALRRLADNPRDVSALVDAGEAALKVGDIEGAMGFFGRARDIAPQNARVKLGMATAFARSRRPVEALRLFAEAEAAGADRVAMASDRGLAFDLVGDAASAQANYRMAMARGYDPELVRRLALSQAIAKDKRGFEATLLPLLKTGDLAAYRTRAIGLAILGETDAAIEIARNMMPPQMATRMSPYLRYMPQLTQAEQAAAGNLGIFPRAASLAAASTPDRVDPRAAGARLRPRGTPLGPTSGSATASPPAGPRAADPRRRPDRTNSRTVRRVEPPADVAREGRAAALDAATRAPTPDLVAAPIPEASTPPPPPAIRLPATTGARVAELPPASGARPVIVAQAPGETGIALASGASTAANTRPVVTAPQPAATEISLADAFASFTLPGASSPSASAGAVDITAITIPREIDEPEPRPAEPRHPSRHWVQVATSRNLGAFGFEWRRIAGKADGKLDGKGPFTAPWVEAHRLLSGPYESASEAREMVKELKGLGIDSFTFTSAEGEEIKPVE